MFLQIVGAICVLSPCHVVGMVAMLIASITVLSWMLKSIRSHSRKPNGWLKAAMVLEILLLTSMGSTAILLLLHFLKGG